MKALPVVSILLIACSVATAQNDKAMILKESENFSKLFVAADYESMANMYTDDAVLMAPGRDPINGIEEIRRYWTELNYRQLKHRLEPVEITIAGDLAYDYGFVYSQSESDGVVSQPNSSKYYTIWKKVNGQWKVHVDMWNSRSNDWRNKK
ncbi:MAG TPA: DUF4440 domain-containing protein [Cyclobacteriaceae bacterium]|nr:DUF4440 domain-containing protein [Cyclobacteriaceae bacterium]